MYELYHQGGLCALFTTEEKAEECAEELGLDTYIILHMPDWDIY